MSDEAVLRIKLEDEGGKVSPSAYQSPSTAPLFSQQYRDNAEALRDSALYRAKMLKESDPSTIKQLPVPKPVDPVPSVVDTKNVEPKYNASPVPPVVGTKDDESGEHSHAALRLAKKLMKQEQLTKEAHAARLDIDPAYQAREEERERAHYDRRDRERDRDDAKRDREQDKKLKDWERQQKQDQNKSDRDNTKRDREEKRETDRNRKQQTRDEDYADKQSLQDQKEEEKQKDSGGVSGFLKGARVAVGGSLGRVIDRSIDLMKSGGGAAAVVPGINLALAVDSAVKGAIKGVMGTAGSVLTGTARTGEDPAETIGQLSSAVSSFGDKIPIIGQALVIVGEAGKILAGLMQEFTKTAERYAEYNPAIAQQLAMNEIRQIMGDMRRAQAAGPELARFVQAQSEMQQQFEEIKMKIWEKILPILTAIMRMISRFLNIAEVAVDDVNEFDPTAIILGEPGAAVMQMP